MSLNLGTIILSGGEGRELLIPDAIRSADAITDVFLLIDSGAVAQKPIAVACEMIPPERRRVFTLQPRLLEYFDCGSARNFGLDRAAEVGVNWALTLDTDVRLILNGFDIRRHLETTECNTIQVAPRHRYYTKELFHRIPAVGRYEEGSKERPRVHEEYLAEGAIREIIQEICFDEIQRTAEEYDREGDHIERVCRIWIEQEPDAARPHLYLGGRLQQTHRYEEAIETYNRYAELSPYDQEKAWAMYQAGVCAHAKGELFRLAKDTETAKLWYARSLELCTIGMRRAPYFPELSWQAAYTEMCAGNTLNAAAWADMALMVGNTIVMDKVRPSRTGFQNPVAAWEGPWEIRRNCVAACGMHDAYEKAVAAIEHARKMRLRACGFEEETKVEAAPAPVENARKWRSGSKKVRKR